MKWKNSGGEKVVDFQFRVLIPHFANTMLAEVFFIF